MCSNNGTRFQNRSPSKRRKKLANSAAAVATASCVAISALRRVRFLSLIMLLAGSYLGLLATRPLIPHLGGACQRNGSFGWASARPTVLCVSRHAPSLLLARSMCALLQHHAAG